MVTIIALCMLLSFIAGGFVTLKAVQLGLRWQMETKQDQTPTMSNPIAEVISKKHTEEANNEQANILNEWLNGEKVG